MEHNEFSWQNHKGLNIYAQTWKPQGAPTAVIALVHGLGEHSGRYRHVAEAFTQAGMALAAFDLPGHGRSSGSRGFTSYEDILFDIDTLLEQSRSRFPGAPVFLYGHSMGGAIVLFYVLRRKPALAGVISSAPGLVPGMPVPASKVTLARLMARVMPSFVMANGLDLQYLSHDAELIRTYQADKFVHDRISARLGLDLLTIGEWILANAKDFSLPLLLVQGSGDKIVSTEATAALARAVPPDKITYKVWEGLYHETHNETEKEKVLAFLVKWVQTILMMSTQVV